MVRVTLACTAVICFIDALFRYDGQITKSEGYVKYCNVNRCTLRESGASIA